MWFIERFRLRQLERAALSQAVTAAHQRLADLEFLEVRLRDDLARVEYLRREFGGEIR